MSRKIAIIGGGNLGAAIADGLIQSEFSRPVELTITRRNLSTLSRFAERGCMVHSDNKKAVKDSEIIIVKELKTVLNPKKHLVVSVVTGAWIQQLLAVIGKPVPVIRAMPNTAIAIQQSMTCLAHAGASVPQLNYIQQLFDQLGKTVIIDEKLMDAATILGACGTAYAMRYIRANIQGGIEIGFDASTATLIAAQTVKGAAELLLQKGTHPEQEIDKVTTPKGCTIAGLNEMEHQGFSSSLIRGIVAIALINFPGKSILFIFSKTKTDLHMKNFFPLLLLFAALSVISCNNEKKEDKADAKTDAPQKVETPGTPAQAQTASAAVTAHVCIAECKDGTHLYAHNEVGHTCTDVCGSPHNCDPTCKAGNHTYAHGESGHTCTDMCIKM